VIRRWVLIGLVLALTCVVSIGCEGDKEHKALLDSLVQRGATQEDVMRELGPGVMVYERGTASWADLQVFLAREPASRYRPLREAVEKYTRILYQTTAWRMTWVFLDERGVLFVRTTSLRNDRRTRPTILTHQPSVGRSASCRHSSGAAGSEEETR
jgi:hypothetical protein